MLTDYREGCTAGEAPNVSTEYGRRAPVWWAVPLDETRAHPHHVTEGRRAGTRIRVLFC